MMEDVPYIWAMLVNNKTRATYKTWYKTPTRYGSFTEIHLCVLLFYFEKS